MATKKFRRMQRLKHYVCNSHDEDITSNNFVSYKHFDGHKKAEFGVLKIDTVDIFFYLFYTPFHE